MLVSPFRIRQRGRRGRRRRRRRREQVLSRTEMLTNCLNASCCEELNVTLFYIVD